MTLEDVARRLRADKVLLPGTRVQILNELSRDPDWSLPKRLRALCDEIEAEATDYQHHEHGKRAHAGSVFQGTAVDPQTTEAIELPLDDLLMSYAMISMSIVERVRKVLDWSPQLEVKE